MLAVATLWRREVTRFVRQRSRVVGALAQPLVFWLLLGGGLSASFRPPGAAPGTSYLAYLYPGILVLVLLFTAIFATISTVEDRHSGFLQGVLVAPVSRTAIVVGQALGGTTLAVGQGLAFLALAPLAGLRLAPLGVLGAVGVMVVVAFGLTNLAADRVADGVDAGLPRHHEPAPDPDLAALGGVLPARRRARAACLADAPRPADLRARCAACVPRSGGGGAAAVHVLARRGARVRGLHVRSRRRDGTAGGGG